MTNTIKDLKALILILLAALTTALLILILFRADSNTNRRNIEFLSSYGWQTEKTPAETAHITIPREFDAVYEAYDRLCQNSGFSLTPYKGVRATRYSYKVLNHEDSGTGLIRANVFVTKNGIIAADISSLALGGFVRTVDDKTGQTEP